MEERIECTAGSMGDLLLRPLIQAVTSVCFYLNVIKEGRDKGEKQRVTQNRPTPTEPTVGETIIRARPAARLTKSGHPGQNLAVDVTKRQCAAHAVG